MKKIQFLVLVFTFFLLMSPVSISATVLTFDPFFGCNQNIEGVPCNGADLPQEYGDRVISTSQDGFTYGSDLGFTPNIVVDYGPLGGNFDIWSDRFGDLQWALDNNNDAQNSLEISLNADVGYFAVLDSFDLANINQSFVGVDPVPDPYIDIFILGSDDDILFSAYDIFVQGETSHTSIDFCTPIISNELQIILDLSSLGHRSDNVAIDNVRFGQFPAPAPVPEPATLLLLGAGIGLLGFSKRKKIRK